MKKYFTEWRENWPEPYPQRYRKNIPYGWVKANATLLMTIANGEVTYPKPTKAGPATRRRRRTGNS